MNLLLLEAAEIDGKQAKFSGRRAAHIRQVLKKSPGDEIRAGVINLGFCPATLTALDESGCTLELGAIVPRPAPTIHLVLALPRPKALSRIISAAASFGVSSLSLINAWRVEKSYFKSPRLDPARMRQDASLGCEQGQQVWLPEITVERSFRRYVEDLDALRAPDQARRLVLHPGAANTLADLLTPEAPSPPRPVILALGPEGGFIDEELTSLQRAGYRPTRLQTGPLKTEVALAAALGQLALVSGAQSATICP